VADLLNPLQMSAAIVFCKLIPGFVTVRKSQVIIQHIHNGPITFKPLDRRFTRKRINFGFHCKNSPTSYFPAQK
jgi:hypothetical protein